MPTDVMTTYGALQLTLQHIKPLHLVNGKDECGCEADYQRRWAKKNLANSKANFKRAAAAYLKDQGHL